MKQKKVKLKFKKPKKDKRGLLKMSIINLALYGFWNIAYIVCLFLRAKAFNTVQTAVTAQGLTASFTVEVTSPMFGVLSVLGKLLPVIIIIWTVIFVRSVKKQKALCPTWMIIAVFVVNFLCGILATADIASLHMVFVG